MVVDQNDGHIDHLLRQFNHSEVRKFNQFSKKQFSFLQSCCNVMLKTPTPTFSVNIFHFAAKSSFFVENKKYFAEFLQIGHILSVPS